MLRLMTEMAKLPVTLLVSGMEVLVRAMWEYQHVASRILDATVDKLGGGAGSNISRSMQEATNSTGAEAKATNVHHPKEKEKDAMINDQALGSEDTKTVRYRIIFTKRNFETTLLERETTVNYATDPMSLSGRKMSDFWAQAALGREHEARKRLIESGYRDIRDAKRPDDPISAKQVVGNPPVQWTIKEEDKKYMAFRADLLDQLPRQKAEFDREQVDVLREIRDAIKEL